MSKQAWAHTCDYVIRMAVQTAGIQYELVSNNNECVHRTNMVRALLCYQSTRAVKGIIQYLGHFSDIV